MTRIGGALNSFGNTVTRHFIVASVCAFALAVSAPTLYAQGAIHGPGGHIPDFAAIHTKISVANGSWSAAGTWSPAGAPAAGDVVKVAHDVSFDSAAGIADIVSIEAGGALRFRTDQNTRLKVGILLVKPGGTLEVGSPTAAVQPDFKAAIVIANRALNAVTDPDQWGTGLLAAGGVVTMQGAEKNPTFVRVAQEPLAGHTIVHVDTPVSGWRVGDEVFLPDTRHINKFQKFNRQSEFPFEFEELILQAERRTIQAISADGLHVTLNAPLTYDHLGAREAAERPQDRTTVTEWNGTKFLPHLANLTRNVVISSENPNGTRGHTVYTHRTDASIVNVEFKDLGRTRAEAVHQTCTPGVAGGPAPGQPCNHVGRYPLHNHHLWGLDKDDPNFNPQYQFRIIGNVIKDSLKWPLAVHASHHGLIADNVVIGGDRLTGAGIAIEDGSETDNLFRHNFVALIRGDINPRESGSDTTTPGSGGECFWGAGFDNRFVDNVASTCRNSFQQVVSGAGFKFFVPSLAFETTRPKVRGGDISNPAEAETVVPQFTKFRQFERNEVYGATASGFTMWHYGTDGFDCPGCVNEDPAAPKPIIAEALIKDLHVWNTYESAVWLYPSNNVTIDGLVHRINPPQVSDFDNDLEVAEPSVQGSDYRLMNITLRNSNIQAGGVFGNASGFVQNLLIENVTATTYYHAFQFDTPNTPGTLAEIDDPPGVNALLKNNVVSPWPGFPLRTISTWTPFGFGPEPIDLDSFPWGYQPEKSVRINVEGYQGIAGENFRVYFEEQLGRSDVLGGAAPCSDTRPEIDGIVCAVGGTEPDLDLDNDGILDDVDTDDDGDGYSDADELACGSDPRDASIMPADIDNDHIPNCLDPVNNNDLDNDGIFDDVDTDDDGDLYSDADELACGSDPRDAASRPADIDNDHIPNCIDPVNNNDSDNDGIFDDFDPDDDNDGQSDVDEAQCGSNPRDGLSVSPDFDGDQSPDCVDADDDNDNAPDATDNCALTANADQRDSDGDLQGDACDADDDGDTIVDGGDNCPLTPNGDQLNTDGDAAGNACDFDDDNDTVFDDADNCVITVNTDQINTDGDAEGDACDLDDDNDGVFDTTDNCPLTANPSQSDLDGDGIGDTCDPSDDRDGDADGIRDVEDNCPTIANSDQADKDGDGIGDACDPIDNRDTDGDGVFNEVDNCPTTANPGQEDRDGDGRGDACDPTDDRDDDGDGIFDTVDNCPTTFNPGQEDKDGDGSGDACDDTDNRDGDGDGFIDAEDNCPLVSNPTQADADGDGIGDACDAPATGLTLTNPGPQTNREKDEVSLQMISNVFDLVRNVRRGKDVQFSATNLPENLHINENTGLIKGHVGQHAVGEYMVTVKVRFDGQVAEVTFPWTITANNRAPQVQSPGNQQSRGGDRISLQIIALDPDGESLEYRANDLPKGLEINRATGLISGTIKEAGAHHVEIEVRADKARKTITFGWLVKK